jgi:hypothetical protein
MEDSEADDDARLVIRLIETPRSSNCQLQGSKRYSSNQAWKIASTRNTTKPRTLLNSET